MFRYGKFSALCEGRWSVPIGSRGGPKRKNAVTYCRNSSQSKVDADLHVTHGGVAIQCCRLIFPVA